MAQISPFPGTGIDRRTGKILSGWGHVLQSLEVIFSTQEASRVMRRWFYSDVPNLLGENMTSATVLRFWSAICVAVDRWEPRFKIVKITAVGTPAGMRKGDLGFNIKGIYYPRGHLGDFTVSVPQSFVAGVNLAQRTVYIPTTLSRPKLPSIQPRLIINNSLFLKSNISVVGDVDLSALRFDDPDLFFSPFAFIPGSGATISPDLFTDLDQFYDLMIQPSSHLEAFRFTDGDSFYAPSAFYSNSISPPLVTKADTIYSPSALSSWTLNPPRIAPTYFVYPPSLSVGVTTLRPNRYNDPDAFYATAVAIGSMELSPALLDVIDEFYSPQILLDGDISPPFISDLNIFYSPSVLGSIGVTPSLFTDPVEAFYGPSVSIWNTLLPTRYTDADVFYSPALSSLRVIQPSIYGDMDTFYTPSMSFARTLQPSRHSNVNSFFAPVVTSTSAIPMSFSDSRFASNTMGSRASVTSGTVSNRTWDDAPNFATDELPVFAWVGGGSDVFTLSRSRVRWREGPRVAPQSGTLSSTFNIDQCYIEMVGRAVAGAPRPDHADGLQAYAPFQSATVNITNTCFRSFKDDEILSIWGATVPDAVGSQAILWADDFRGSINLTNVLIWGGARGLWIYADSGTTRVKLNKVYFVASPGGWNSQKEKWEVMVPPDKIGVGTMIIEEWNEVYDATIVDGQIVIGAAIPPPGGTTEVGFFEAQSGNFTMTWDAVPSASPEDSVCGLSLGAPSAFSSFACAVRFWTTGFIQARNGGAYAADASIPYSAGQSFHIRMVVRVPLHTYDVYITPQGGSEITLATNYAFRTEQASVASLNYLGKMTTDGDITITNGTITNDVTIQPSRYNDADTFFTHAASGPRVLLPSRYNDADTFFAPSIAVPSVVLYSASPPLTTNDPGNISRTFRIVVPITAAGQNEIFATIKPGSTGSLTILGMGFGKFAPGTSGGTTTPITELTFGGNSGFTGATTERTSDRVDISGLSLVPGDSVVVTFVTGPNAGQVSLAYDSTQVAGVVTYHRSGNFWNVQTPTGFSSLPNFNFGLVKVETATGDGSKTLRPARLTLTNSFFAATVTGGTVAPAASIPLSYNDSRYAANTPGPADAWWGNGAVTTSKTYNNNTWDDSPTFSQGEEVITWKGTTSSHIMTLNKCRYFWREGVRVSTGNEVPASNGLPVLNLNECFCSVIGRHPAGQGEDHADGVQAFGTRGIINATNTTFRSHSMAEAAAIIPADGIGSDAFRWADAFVGEINFNNVMIYGGGRGISISADTGETKISFENVYIVDSHAGSFAGSGFYRMAIGANGGTITIVKWINVCLATIVNGVIVPGTQLANPGSGTNVSYQVPG